MCVQKDDLKEHIRILREEKTQLAGLLPPFSDMTGLLVAYSLLTLRVCVCVWSLCVYQGELAEQIRTLQEEYKYLAGIPHRMNRYTMTGTFLCLTHDPYHQRATFPNCGKCSIT